MDLMRRKLLSAGLILVGLLVTPGLALSQTAQENRILIVSGQPGQAPVIQKNGKSYVDVEALARLTNGSLSFKGNQITLTLPASTASTPTATPPASQPANSAFSKDFLKAGIETMAVIREWRGTLVSNIQNGYPVSNDFVAGFRDQAVKNLRFAYVAVATDSDRNAYQLLSNEVDNMQKFSNNILAAYQNMQNINPDTLKEDPLLQQILSCARSLVSMAASGQFQDDGSCH
jgi:hypothetical protein